MVESLNRAFNRNLVSSANRVFDVCVPAA